MNNDDKTPQQPLIIRISVWMVALIDLAVSVFLSGLAYLRLHQIHHVTPWFDIVMEGLAPGSAMFGLHLWLRSRWPKRHTEPET
jgi:hypothetical protein